MQTCRYCSFQFDDLLDRCPECGTKVRRKARAAEPSMQLALIASARSAPEAEILCSILQSEGIAYLTECPDGFSAVFGGVGGQTDVYVSKADEQRASVLLEEFSSAESFCEEPDVPQEGPADPSQP